MSDIDVLLRLVANNGASGPLDQLTASLQKAKQQGDLLATAFRDINAATSQGMSGITSYAHALQTAAKQAESFGNALGGVRTHVDGFKVDGVISGMRQIRDATEIAKRSLADIQTQMEKLNRMRLTSPTPSGGSGSSAGGGSRSSSGGHPFGAGLVQNVVQGAGYTLGYDALSYAQQGFSNSLAYQRQTAVNAATTDVGTLSPAQRKAIDSYVTGMAASGTQPYGKLTLAQGLAPIEGATTNLAAIRAVNQAGYMGSAITGSTDTLTMNQTLTQILGSYGIRDPKAMGAQAMGYEDVIQNMINKGLVQPSQVAGSIPTFSGYAASVGMSFQNAGGVFGALTNYTKDPQMAAQQERALIADVTSGPMRNKHQRAAIQAAGLGDYFGPDAMKMDPTKWLTGVESHIAKDPGKYLPLLFPNQDALAAMQNLVGQGGANMGTSTGIFAAMGRTGTTQAGYEQYSQNPAAKFDNAATKFNTSVETLAAAITPFATVMANQGAAFLQAITDLANGPGGKGGLPGSVAGASDTAWSFLRNPGAGINAARNTAATMTPGAGYQFANPSGGGGLVHVGQSGWGPLGHLGDVPGILGGVPGALAGAPGQFGNAVGDLFGWGFGSTPAQAAFVPPSFVGPRQSSLHDTLLGGYHATSDPAWRDDVSADVARVRGRFYGRDITDARLTTAGSRGPAGSPTNYAALDLLAAGGHAAAPVDITGIARSAYFTAQGQGIDYAAKQAAAQGARRDSLLGAASGAYFSNQAAGIDYAHQAAITAADKQLQAAQLFDQSVHMHGGSVQQQQSSLNAMIMAMHTDASARGLKGDALTAWNANVSNVQFTGQQAIDQSAVGKMQQQITLAKMRGDTAGAARLTSQLTKYQSANASYLFPGDANALAISNLGLTQGAGSDKATALQQQYQLAQAQGNGKLASSLIGQILSADKTSGMNPTMLALTRIQLEGGIPQRAGPQNIRPASMGPGDLEATFGNVAGRSARLGGQDASQRQMMAALQQQLEASKESESHLREQLAEVRNQLRESRKQTALQQKMLAALLPETKTAPVAAHSSRTARHVAGH